MRDCLRDCAVANGEVWKIGTEANDRKLRGTLKTLMSID